MSIVLCAINSNYQGGAPWQLLVYHCHLAHMQSTAGTQCVYLVSTDSKVFIDIKIYATGLGQLHVSNMGQRVLYQSFHAWKKWLFETWKKIYNYESVAHLGTMELGYRLCPPPPPPQTKEKRFCSLRHCSFTFLLINKGRSEGKHRTKLMRSPFYNNWKRMIILLYLLSACMRTPISNEFKSIFGIVDRTLPPYTRLFSS